MIDIIIGVQGFHLFVLQFLHKSLSFLRRGQQERAAWKLPRLSLRGLQKHQKTFTTSKQALAKNI